MNDSITITSGTLASPRRHESIIMLVTIAILCGTLLRVSLLVIYPLVVFFISSFYRFRMTSSFIILVCLALFCFTLSLFDNFFLRYKLLSLYYMIPFLMLLFLNPIPERTEKLSHMSLFFACLTIVALVNDVTGIFQVINNPGSDDSFIGIYSQYSVSINGLMLLNTVLFVYYLLLLLQHKKAIYLIPTLFFGISANLGFYGAGLVIFIIALIFTFFTFSLTAVIRTAAIGLVALALVYLSMYLIKPLVLEYNIANIKKILSFDVEKGPRKLTSFYNYGISYPSDTKDFLLGSGPGTFNSRSAFMVGSPSYFTGISFIKDDEQPYYFRNYAYTLWNEKNTIQALYLDGFRNQPFSSVLAFLGEYGLIFTLVFSWLYYDYFMRVTKLYRTLQREGKATTAYRVFKFSAILLPLLLLIDNYLEYPEIMLLMLVSMKLAHGELLTLNHHYAHEH